MKKKLKEKQVIQALGKLRLEGHEFKASLDYVARVCPNKERSRGGGMKGGKG
jgi:hypothetical protein